VKKAVQFSDEVKAGRQSGCARGAAGVRSANISRAYSVGAKNGVHHFHMLLRESLSEPEFG